MDGTPNARPDELIVDSRFHDGVLTMLRDLGVWTTAGVEDVSTDLELVLLSNLALDAYVSGARQRYANEIAALETPARAFTPLDVLLYDLRARFTADRGFVPVLGKNREAIIGQPQHKGIAVVPTVLPFLPGSPPVHIDTAGTGAVVRVGIVDTPLAPHPLLPRDVVDRDEEFHADGGPPQPWAGHATFVAGLVRQAAGRAHLDVRAGLRADSGENSAWTVAKKIASFRGSGIAVLNLSLGCETDDHEPPLVIRRALDVLGSDVQVVAAAGNNHIVGTDTRQVWPAASTSVVAVGARAGTMPDGDEATFSTIQPWVDVVADGISVLSTYLSDGYALWHGTSFAAATVSGTIAAMVSKDGISPQEAVEKLKAGASPAVDLFTIAHP